jgi:SAM-dependent methyltransferase
MPDDAVRWYDDHTAEVVGRYESVDPAVAHAWLDGLIPKAPATAIDIGAGTGRDAAWLASRGFDVVAVEPSGAMQSEGRRRHANPRIQWINDRLPELSLASALGIAFDIVMLNAVWQHVAPTNRERAFRKVTRLLRPGGLLIVTLRVGPSPPGRSMYPVSLDEIELLARNYGFKVEKVHRGSDALGREDVSWTCVALRLPDDGTGALPLLRHVILNDQKSATYKLGLLRALCRIADGSAGLIQDTGDSFVKVPLGLVALYWVRLYLPLVREGLPQTPTNVGMARLGFARGGFKALLDAVSANDLRIGMRFSDSRAHDLHSALRDAARTIDRMPSTFMKYPEGQRILPVELGRGPQSPKGLLEIDADYLEAFGWMLVPAHLWRAMRQFSAWIEPTLTAEWSRLMHDYAEKQGSGLNPSSTTRAMRWIDPERDVKRVQKIALKLLDTAGLRCVWSDKVLNRETLDIDHMFPWSAWPCSDLWNLVPSHRDVNQRQKRDRLPSAARLSDAAIRITDWWKQAYLNRGELQSQFFQEATASLPPFPTSQPSDVLASVTLQRIHLHHSQQVPEWT